MKLETSFFNPSFALEEQVDDETLFYMNDMDLLKPFKLSYKNQIMFLKEREKLFLSKAIQEKSTSPPISNGSPLLVIDENKSEAVEVEIELIQSSINITSRTTTITTKSLEKEKPFPDPYLLPPLPNQVTEAITLKQMIKFEKLCNFRAIVIDAIFHDLKTKYSLL